MQNERGADLCPEMPRIGGDGAQRLRRDIEQQPVDDGLVVIRDRADRRRQRKDDVVVLDGQEIRLTRFEPAVCSASLAPRTMSIAARIVSDFDRGAPLATQHVASQRRAAALFDRGHDLQLPEAQVGGLTPRWAKRAKDVCYLERAMRHDGDLLGMQTLKRADHLAQNIGGDLGIKRCGLKLLVPKHDLNHADIDLLFQ